MPPQPLRWKAAAHVAVGVFMATLDSSIVNISLPAMARHFHVPLAGDIEWVVIAYLMAIAATLMTLGRLADLFGRKRLWLGGLAVFTVGSGLCAAAPSLGVLIAFRALQGVGGSLLMAISPAMLTDAFPPAERGKALGFNAVIVAIGVSVGPTLGGLLTQGFSWRWIFLINLPIGALGLAAAWIMLPDDTRHGKERFDPLGAALLAVALATFAGALSFGDEVGWGSAPIVAALAVAVVSGVAFVIVERRVASPVVDLALFRDRVFAAATVSLVLSFLALFAVSFLLPFYFEQVRHFGPAKSGLLLTPLPAALAIVAPLSGRHADRGGGPWLSSSGLGLSCVGLILLALLGSDASIVALAAPLVLIGVGQGLFQSPNNRALLGAAPDRARGVASGVLATGRVTGQCLSVALAGAVFHGLGGADAGIKLMKTPAAPGQLVGVFMHAMHLAFVVCAIIAVAGVVTALVRGESKPSRRAPRDRATPRRAVRSKLG